MIYFSMNKRLIFAAIALILVIGGVVGARVFGTKTTQQLNSEQNLASDTNNAEENVDTNGFTSQNVSLKQLLQMGIPQRCAFKQSGMYASEGLVMISGGKVRGDFQSAVDGQAQATHLIVDGNTSYLWVEGQNTGFKTTFDSNVADDLKENTPDTFAQSFDANANLDYKCSPWTVDNSVFVLPSNVSFTDLNSQLSSQCGMCESLTGDSKTQCLTALKCS